MRFALLMLIFVQGIITSQYLANHIDGYSSSSQFISELGANSAPYQLFVNTSIFLPVGLAILLLVYLSHCHFYNNQKLNRAGWLLALPGVAYLGSVFFPCQPGCPLLTSDPSQIIHNILGLLEYLGAIFGMLIWTLWFKKVDAGGYKTISWIALLLIVIGFTGMIIPYLSEYRGLLQRMADYSYFVWLSLLVGYAPSNQLD